MSHLERQGLVRRMTVLGAISVAAFVAIVILAPPLAAFAPVLVRQRDEIAFIDHLARQLHWLPGAELYLRTAIRDGMPLANPYWRALAAALPLGAAAITMLLAVRELHAEGGHVGGPAADRIALRVAVLITLVAVIALPTYTPDFWLSVAWGRMFAEGRNPYYDPFTLRDFEGIPGGGFEAHERYTYGPLWAILVGTIAQIADRNVLAEFMLHKMLLAGAWLGTLVTLRRAAGRHGTRRQFVVTCLIGWLPAGAYFAVAEGHNDVVMVLFVALWLDAVDRGDHRLAPLWLACSCLIKFVTLPLLGLELLAARRAGVLLSRRYTLTMAACTALALLAVLAVYDGPGFLSSTRSMQRWVFWVPSTYVVTAAQYLGIRLPLLRTDALFAVLGLGLTGLILAQALRRPTWDTWARGGMAVVACLLLSLVGHVWPWFSLWLVPFLAFLWPGRAAAVALTFLLLVPFLNLAWILAPDWHLRPILNLWLYTTVLGVIGFLVLRGQAALGQIPADALPDPPQPAAPAPT